MPSDQIGAGTGTTSQPQSASSLLDSQGRSMNESQGRSMNSNAGSSNAGSQLQQTTGQVEEFIRTQPISAALIALGIGYILGRIGL
jgi:hypothetical protein